MFRAGRIVFTQQRFFIESQVACNGAHKPVAKYAARQLPPIFIFQGLDKASADSRGLGEFIHGNFTQFALALQAFAKISSGHEPEPVLEYQMQPAKRLTRAGAREKS